MKASQNLKAVYTEDDLKKAVNDSEKAHSNVIQQLREQLSQSKQSQPNGADRKTSLENESRHIIDKGSKKKTEEINREEVLRQGRIAFGKADPLVQDAALKYVEDIKAGKTLVPVQIELLSRFSIFDDVLIPYLKKSADAGGFQDLLKATGVKQPDRIRESQLVFGAFTEREQQLITIAVGDIKEGKNIIPDVYKMLDRINILKEMMDEYYEKQARSSGIAPLTKQPAQKKNNPK